MGDFIRDPDGSVPTCSAQGGASGTTAIDTMLTFYESDYFNEWYFVLPLGPTGSEPYEVTRVSDFVFSTGTLTLEPNASGQIASGQTYELHRYNPAAKHLALNAAREQAANTLWLPAVDETLVFDNLLSNWDFEDFSGGNPDSWTETSGNWTQETTRLKHGSSAITVAASGADAQLTQNLFTAVNVDQVVTNTINIRGHVFATAASTARLRVSFDGGTTFTNGPYHGGKDAWEGPSVQYITVRVPADSTSITVYLEVADGGTAYFDAVVAWVGKINRYTVPSAIYHRPSYVKQNVDPAKVGTDADWMPVSKANPPIPGHIIRLEGKSLLTEATTETTSVEVSAPETQLLYAEAMDWLLNHEMGQASEDARTILAQDKVLWATVAQRIKDRGWSARPNKLQFPDGGWQFLPEGETNLLWFRGR